MKCSKSSAVQSRITLYNKKQQLSFSLFVRIDELKELRKQRRPKSYGAVIKGNVLKTPDGWFNGWTVNQPLLRSGLTKEPLCIQNRSLMWKPFKFNGWTAQPEEPEMGQLTRKEILILQNTPLYCQQLIAMAGTWR